MDRLPFPDFAVLEEQPTFDAAMTAYAQYAGDHQYPYLAAWRPWLHVASQLRGRYATMDEVIEDTGDSRCHFFVNTTQ